MNAVDLHLPRLAVLSDFREEQWPSMDLVAEMLVDQLQRHFADSVRVTSFCPPFRRSVSKLPIPGIRRTTENAERLINRMWHYPRAARRISDSFDIFHVADHSYAQLVHALPASRTGVFCHDLDTFRCIFQPSIERRPRWFRAMTRHIASGLQKAAIVFHSTAAVREQIERHDVIDPARLVAAPYGTSPEFDAHPIDPEPAATILAEAWGDEKMPFVLHVGSCIPRKRIDVLLDVSAEVWREHPELRLLQVGGTWTDDQRQQIQRLGIGNSVTQLRGLSREQLASLYRTAQVVLQPSEAEGFGLPVIEALACGSTVVASDLPVLKEVGGDAVMYCPVADVECWARAVSSLLDGSTQAPLLAARLAQAALFSWTAHARTILDAYNRLLR